ncbi:MAG: CDP-alcohol phosphatidyltransferase family protein, partial [Candidatus Thorarchaeota archaeon]
MTKGSFKTFKKICQEKKLEKQKRDKEWWHAVPRFISRYITWILVKTPISANFITIFSVIVCIAGLIFIGLANPFLILLGFIFLYIYLVLDEVDGEVARYKEQTSIHGIFFDEIGHLFIHTGLFFTFGYSIYRITRDELFLILGILTALFFLGIRIIRRIPLVAGSKGGFRK